MVFLVHHRCQVMCDGFSFGGVRCTDAVMSYGFSFGVRKQPGHV